MPAQAVVCDSVENFPDAQSIALTIRIVIGNVATEFAIYPNAGSSIKLNQILKNKPPPRASSRLNKQPTFVDLPQFDRREAEPLGERRH